MAWYTILTVVFRCPSQLQSCNESTPNICAPWLRAKSAVQPHLAPYYEAYAEPYLELSRPYYNTALEQVFVPVYKYAAVHAAPRIEIARQYGQQHWDKELQPQLSLYQKRSQQWYDAAVAPYVERARLVSDPYVQLSKMYASRAYIEKLKPAYDLVFPYAATGYSACADFTTKTIVPSTHQTLTTVYLFLDGIVWPHVRVLYTENVEPKLLKIGERLGRHKHDVVASTSHRYIHHISCIYLDLRVADNN